MSLRSVGPSVLGLAGNILGGIVGGPIGAAVGGMAGGLLGSFLFNRNNKPMVPDVFIMSSSYGHPIPIIWGTVRLPGVVIWQGDLVTRGHPFAKGVGGQATYSYLQSCNVAFCEGPAKLVKCYLDGKLFIDMEWRGGAEILKDHQPGFAWREYQGVETQLPDPSYVYWVNQHVVGGSAMATANRDLFSIVFDSLDEAYYGNRFPQVAAVVSSTAQDTTIFKHLNKVAADTSTLSYSIGGQSTTCVDWLRGQVYSIATNLGNTTQQLRVFDIATNMETRYKPMATILGANVPVDWTGAQVVAVAQIVCTQGGKIYLIGNEQHLANSWIYTIDPDTLTCIEAKQCIPLYNGFYANFNNVMALTVVGITSSQSDDLLVGHVGQSSFALCVINPFTGNFGYGALAEAGQLAEVVPIVGNVDYVAGTTDLWVVNGDADTLILHIFHAKITTNDPSQFTTTSGWAEVGSLTWNDFGNTGTPPTGTTHPNTALAYDPTDNTLIINDYGGLVKWSQSSGIVYVTRPSQGLNPGARYLADRSIAAGMVNESYPVFDFATGTSVLSPIAAGDPDAVNLGGITDYSSYPNAGVGGSGSEMYIVYLQRRLGAEVPVSQIITDICARVGLDATMIDVSLVTATTQGWAIMDQKTAGSALKEICQTYQIDMVESDYLLKFVPKGQASVATITQDDLGSQDANNQALYWLPNDPPEQEMPLQITLRFADPALDYQPGSTAARRTALPVPTQYSKRVQLVDMPLTASQPEAVQIVEKWLWTMWAERVTYTTLTGPKYLWLDPCDNVTVNLNNGDSYTVRITHMEVGADWSIHWDMCDEDATTYAGSTTPGASYGTTAQTLAVSPFGAMLLFNVPLLQDSDDLGGTQSRIYFAAGPYSGTWAGGAAYKSTDDVNWTQASTIANGATWGTALNALGDTVSTYSTDYTNTLTVAMKGTSTDLSSCTYLEMMNGANALLVGSEIIQFMTVTDPGDGSLVLSGLLRGRRGTEWATGSHTTFETVILLEAGPIIAARLTLAEINATEHWRLVPNGRWLDQAVDVAFAYKGYDLKPYVPVNFARAKTPIGGTFDPANKGFYIGLSNGNLTAGQSGGVGGGLWDSVRTTGAIASGRKVVWEMHVDVFSGAVQLGIAGASAAMSTYITATNGAAIQQTSAHTNAQMVVNGTDLGDIFAAPLAAGTYVMFALDTTAKKLWATIDGTNWNPSLGGGNPATGTGGIDVSAVTGSLYQAVSLYYASDQVTYNPGAAGSFHFTPPAGFAANDLTITWTRQSRLAGYMVDGVDTVQLAETSELYDVYSVANAAAFATFDPTNAATYLRAFTGLTSPTLSYPGEDLSADGIDPIKGNLYLAVCQVSAVVGAGFFAKVTLTPPDNYYT